MRIKLATPLIGEFPRYADVKLPDNAAVIAQNMRLDSGVLKPLNGYTQGATLNGNLVFTAQHQTKTVMPLGSGVYDVVG
jgi:hypothetical protein